MSESNNKEPPKIKMKLVSMKFWNMNTKGFLFRLIGFYSIIMGIIYGTIMLFGYYYQYVNNITMNYVGFIGIILGYIILLGM